MSALESQSLASGREPRIKKTTQRAQQMLEDLQQRHAHEKKAKVAASVASQPKLLNNEGDNFLYGPAESYAPPTLTGDDALDHLRFDEAEAKHILKLLAHRGDGDWQIPYQEHQVNLEDLRQARDNPGADILKQKVQGMPSAATKGKGRAVDDEHDGEAPGSRRETIYTGITIGRTPPAASSHGHNAHDTRQTPPLEYPPPERRPLPKRPVPSQDEQPLAKKPRVERESDWGPNTDNMTAKTSAQVLPSPPTVHATGPAAAASKEPAAKPAYGGPRPSTNLQLISCGGSTAHRTTPGLANSQLGKPPIKPSAEEQPHQGPGLDRQEALPQKARHPRPEKSNDDRLYSVPPQPRAYASRVFAYQPPSRKPYPTSRSNGNTATQVPVSKNAATADRNRDYQQPPEQAGLIMTANNRPHEYAPPVVRLVTRERASATVKGRSAHHGQPEKPLDLPVVPMDRASAQPDPITKFKPKRAPEAAKMRGIPRKPIEEPLAAPQVRKDRAGARPHPIPKPKRAPDAVKKRTVPREPVDELAGMSLLLSHVRFAYQLLVATPQVHKHRAGAHPTPIPKPKHTPDAAKKRTAPREPVVEPAGMSLLLSWIRFAYQSLVAAPHIRKDHAGARPDPIPKPKRVPDAATKRMVPRQQAREYPAEHRVAKDRAATRPDPIRKRASEVAKRHGAAHRAVEAPSAEPRMAANRPARNEQPPARSPQRFAAPSDDDAGPEDDETAVEEGNDDDFGATHVFRLVSSNSPTVNSYPHEVQPVVKCMAIQAKPWIVSCGTFDWRKGDPGDEVPTSDTIVARCFARACRELQKKFLFRDDHVKTVNILAVIMALIEKHGEFKDGRPDYNSKLSAWFLPDAFHEGEPKSKGDWHPFESPLVSKAIARALFGTNNYGLKFAELFNPIPLRFLAFICCIMNHVIYCYRSGYFNKKDRLVSTQQELSFQQYLGLLGEMQRKRPKALRELCGTLYDQARLEAAQAETRVEAPRSPRRWAPDIQEEYILQFKEHTPLPDNETEDEPEDEDRVERREARHGHNQANKHARLWAPPLKRSKPDKGKRVLRPGPSDDETTPARVRSSREPYGYQAIDDNNDRGEGPSRPYGMHPLDEDDEAEDRGEGPSRPYGARVVCEDEDESLPSPRRAFLRDLLPVSEPSDPELEPSDPELEPSGPEDDEDDEDD